MDSDRRFGRGGEQGRRTFLSTLGAATLGGVAGCLGGESGDTDTDTDTDTGSEIPGLQLSLRADEGVTTDDEGRVQTWVDQSPAGNDFPADMPEAGPTLTEDAVEGQSALTFDGEDDHLMREDTLGIPNDSPRTVVVVARLAESTGRSPIFTQGKFESNSQHYGIEANTFRSAGERFGVYAINRSYDSSRATDTNYHIHTLRTGSFANVGEVEDTTTYYIDGAETSLEAVSSKSADDATFEAEATSIGSYVKLNDNSHNVYSGEIAAVKVYDRALSDDERSTVESTLADRYGIELA